MAQVYFKDNWPCDRNAFYSCYTQPNIMISLCTTATTILDTIVPGLQYIASIPFSIDVSVLILAIDQCRLT